MKVNGPAPAPGREGEGSGAFRETILVVDDQGSIRKILLHVLKSQGYRVLEAGDGLEAIRKIVDSDGPVDLVITDLMMPVMGGDELLEYLAVLRPGMKAMCLSASVQDLSLRDGVLYFPKPFSLRSLARGVADILAGVYGKRSESADRRTF